MNRLALLGWMLAGILGTAACSDNDNDVGTENEASSGSAGNPTAEHHSGGASVGGADTRSGGRTGAESPAGGSSSSSGGVGTGGSVSGSGGFSAAGDGPGAGGLSAGGAGTATGGASTGGSSGSDGALGGAGAASGSAGASGGAAAGASGHAGSAGLGSGGVGTAGHSGTGLAGSAGSAGAGGGGTGLAGNAGAGGTGGCPPLPSCNWCQGDALRDSNGCIAGWLCPNGIDPCAVAQCPSGNECAANETCYRDGLCWPSEAARIQGEFVYVPTPCTTDPCLPGLVAAIAEHDTSMTYILVVGSGWATSDYDWQSQWEFEATAGVAVIASGRLRYRTELDGRRYTELELHTIGSQMP